MIKMVLYLHCMEKSVFQLFLWNPKQRRRSKKPSQDAVSIESIFALLQNRTQFRKRTVWRCDVLSKMLIISFEKQKEVG